MLPLLFAAALAGAPPKPTLLVLDLVPRVGVTTELAKALTDVAVAEARKRAPDSRVIGAEDVRSLMDVQAQKSRLGCADTGCLAELGGALGARQVIWGSLAKVGREYLIDLRLVDSAKALVLKESTRKIGGRDDQLLDALPGAVDELFGIAAPPPVEPPPEPVAQPQGQFHVQQPAYAPAPYAQPSEPYVAAGPSQSPPSRSTLVTVGEILTGVGVLAGVGAGAAMGFGYYTNNSIKSGGFSTAQDIQSQSSAGQTANTIAWGTGIPAIALVVVGVTLWSIGAATR